MSSSAQLMANPTQTTLVFFVNGKKVLQFSILGSWHYFKPLTAEISRKLTSYRAVHALTLTVPVTGHSGADYLSRYLIDRCHCLG